MKKIKSSPYRGKKGSVLSGPTRTALHKLLREIQTWTDEDWDRVDAARLIREGKRP